MPHPAQYAVQLLSRFEPLLHLLCHILHMSNCRFQSRAKAHGVAHAPVQLVHGDFLKNSDVSNAISSAGLIFMNNPKFGAALNFKVLGQQNVLVRVRSCAVLVRACVRARACVRVRACACVLIFLQLIFCAKWLPAPNSFASIGRAWTQGLL